MFQKTSLIEKTVYSKTFLYIISCYLIFSIIAFFFIDYKFILALTPILFLLFIFIIFSKIRFFLFLFFLLSVFPQRNLYSLLPSLTSLLMLILLFITFLHIHKINWENRIQKVFIIFLVYLLFSTIWGLIQGYSISLISNESMKWLFYPCSFFFTLNLFQKFSLDKNKLENFLKYLSFILLGFALMNAIEHLILYIFFTKGGRVITRQTIILGIGISISLGYFLFYNLKKYQKIIIGLLFLFYLLGIIISMQRSLWVAIIIAFIISFLFYLKKRKWNFFSMELIILLFLIFFLFSLGNEYVRVNELLISERVDTFEEGIETRSMLVRFVTYNQVFKRIKENLIFGKGLGDTLYVPILYSNRISFVDNSYLQTLWKMGFVGIVIFFIIIGNIFKKIYYILKYSSNKVYLLFSFSIGLSLLIAIINGLTCVVLTQYYFNFIWGSFMAIIYYIHKLSIKKDMKIVKT